jgi:hypothetical protein
MSFGKLLFSAGDIPERIKMRIELSKRHKT